MRLVSTWPYIYIYIIDIYIYMCIYIYICIYIYVYVMIKRMVFDRSFIGWELDRAVEVSLLVFAFF